MDLSPEERKRIYEEGKAKIELRDFTRKFQRKQPVVTDPDPEPRTNNTWAGCLGAAIVVVLIVAGLSTLFESGGHKEPSSTGTSPAPSDAGFVKGLGRDVLRQELDQWRGMGLVSNYEFSDESVVVYLDHATWIALPAKPQADFKAGIRAKWPDGSVTFRDSRMGERL